MYELRTDTGTLVMTLSNSRAQRFMDHSDGHFQERRFKKAGRKTIYVFDHAALLTLNLMEGDVQIYIWDGYYLVQA